MVALKIGSGCSDRRFRKIDFATLLKLGCRLHNAILETWVPKTICNSCREFFENMARIVRIACFRVSATSRFPKSDFPNSIVALLGFGKSILASRAIRAARAIFVRRLRPVSAPKFAIPGSWYRAQKPLKPGNTKKIRKSHEIPHPGSGPQKYEKNTEKIRKWPENDRFRIFSVFFSYFWGPTWGGGFRDFFVFFSYFRA